MKCPNLSMKYEVGGEVGEVCGGDVEVGRGKVGTAPETWCY